MASRCDEPDWARQLLKLFTIDDGRSFWQALDDGRLAEIYKGNKKTHLKALKQKTGVAFEDMLFFDDDMENIRNVSELGVVSVLTPEGVTADAWESGPAPLHGGEAHMSGAAARAGLRKVTGV